MKRLVLGVAAALLLASCAGLKAREHVLVPAMAMAWVGIAADVEAGLPAISPPEGVKVRGLVQAMEVALASENADAVLAVDWLPLRACAELGISLRLEGGAIGPGVAASLRERLAVFTEALFKLRTP